MLYALMFLRVPEGPEQRPLHNTGILWGSRHFNDQALSGGGWRNRVGGESYRRCLLGWRDVAPQRFGARGVPLDPERLQVLGRTRDEAGAAVTRKTLREGVQGRRGRAKGPVARS